MFGDIVGSFTKTFEAGRGALLWQGFVVTVQVTAGAIGLGILIGIVLAYFKLSRLKILNAISFVYLGIIRGTPVVLQLLIVQLVLFSGFRGNRVWVAIVALGINSGAYVAELIRGGIQSVDKGQTEAGLSLGLSKTQTMIFIVMPQAIKNILPSFINEFIMLTKETAIVGWAGVQDLTRIAQQITVRTFDAMPLLVSGAIYLTFISILTFFLSLIEKYLRKSDRG